MRSARITYVDALNHIRHQGIDGEEVFFSNQEKKLFLDIVKKEAGKSGIKIFAYCITDNEYQLLVQNTSGKLSEFLKNINKQYSMDYRKKFGEKGKIFFDRVFSILIQDESYLKIALAKLLLTPVRKGITDRIDDYLWSSVNEYFKQKDPSFPDTKTIKRLFQTKAQFLRYHQNFKIDDVLNFYPGYGYIMGDKTFADQAINMYSTMVYKKRSDRSIKTSKKRIAPESLISQFEKEKNINLDKIDTHSFPGKRLRGELIVYLREKGKIPYKVIAEIPFFSDIKSIYLGRLCCQTKKRLLSQNIHTKKSKSHH